MHQCGGGGGQIGQITGLHAQVSAVLIIQLPHSVKREISLEMLLWTVSCELTPVGFMVKLLSWSADGLRLFPLLFQLPEMETQREKG